MAVENAKGFIDKTTAEPGETIRPSMTAKNTGSLPTDALLRITRQDTATVVKEKVIEDLQAGEVAQIFANEASFSMPQNDVALLYESFHEGILGGWAKDDEDTRTVTVAGEANVKVSSISMPSTLTAGDFVEANALLVNTGSVSGSRTFTVTVNGERIQSVSASLGPGESVTRTFDFTAPQPTSARVCVGDPQQFGTCKSVPVNEGPEEPPEEAGCASDEISIAGSCVGLTTLAVGGAGLLLAMELGRREPEQLPFPRRVLPRRTREGE